MGACCRIAILSKQQRQLKALKKDLVMYESFAQNFEDVLLNRVFGNAQGGFYVDVGACHPNFDSVTRLFYERGWSGLNLDPSTYYQKLLAKHRPRDTNLKVAASSSKGRMDFFEVMGTGYSALSSDAIDRATLSGVRVQKSKVAVDTLSAILDQYAAGKSIDFLKIDVEGHERDVILGLDFIRHRPKLILVEAVHPDSHLPQWELWESLLTQAGYLFAVFDGLNRFYVEKTHADWVSKLQVAPNVFDGFYFSRRHGMVKQSGFGFKALLRHILPAGTYVLLRNYYHLLRQRL
jgi:FkbM family methyltransferase